MKKLTLLLSLLLLSATANAADYYFSNSSGGNIAVAGSNSNPCSLAAPCNDFKGTTLDNAGALSPGDTIWLDAGDEWEGSTAEIRIISNGTSANRITLKGYGSGKAKLSGLVDSASGWTYYATSSHSGGGDIYYIGSVTFSEFHVYSVIESSTVGLFKWGSGYGNTLAAMPKGHFWFDASADRIYVNTWNGANPNTLGTMMIPNTTTAPSFDGKRGLICTGCENGSYGDYVTIDMTHIKIVGANGMGITLGGVYNKIIDDDGDSSDANIMGAGKDGILAYQNQIAGEEADDLTVENIRITYSAAAGTGHGQAFTTYSPRTLFYKCIANNNAMAGFDFLVGYIAAADVAQSACKFCTSYDNGIWGDPDGYDPNFYVDGGNNVLIKDSVCYNGGVGSTTGASNSRACITIGAENPSVDPAYNVEVVNSFIHNTNWFGINTQNIPGTVDNITGIKIIGNTIVSRRTASTSDDKYNFGFSDWSTAPDGFLVKYNIFYGENGSYIDPRADTDAFLDADYNLYYTEGGSSTILRNADGVTTYTLASWQAASGKDANSINSDPLFVTDTQGSYDVHLRNTATGHASTSPAVNAGPASHGYSCPSWVYTQWPSYFPECASGQDPLQGTTRSDSVMDTGNLDLGYHYPIPPPSGPGTLTVTNVEPASLYTSANGNVVISFTTENDWDSDGKLVVVFPSNPGTGFALSTHTASCTLGCNGSLAVGISGQTMTITRSGGTTTSGGTGVSITVSNVTNPNATGTSDNYSIQTQTSAGTVIDTDGSVSGDTFTSTPSTSTHTIEFTGTMTITGNSINITFDTN